MRTDAAQTVMTWELSERECWARLQRAEIGRIAVVADGRPVIYPVGYAVVPGGLLIRTRPGGKLLSILLDGRAALEIDEHDERSGWSVLVMGQAEEVSRDDHVGIPPRSPFAGTGSDALVLLTPLAVTGRELRLD